MQNLASPQTPVKSYSLRDWKQGYESQEQEDAYWLDDFEGEIPPELHGTLFRNGPGLLEIYGQPLKHPFDGDGMVCAISFENGRAYFRNRFVRTAAFVAERDAKAMLYRGVFGSQKPGGWWNNAFDLRLKNIANTSVIYWGGKLLALWEAAEPHRLDPYSLETLGLDTLDGILPPGEMFAAHPWVDPSCELDGGNPCLVNFATQPGLSTAITLYELDPQGKLLRKHVHRLPGFAFVHDFAITPHYCIFFQYPVSYNPLPFILGLKGAGECLQLQRDRLTRIAIIPRTPPYEGMQILEAEAGFVFHHANAFERDAKQLCVDSICYPSLPKVEASTSFRDINFEALAPGQLWRFTLDLQGETVERQLLEGRCCEFPMVAPDRAGRPYRYLYLGAAHNPTGNAPLQAILKLDLETGERQVWSAAPRGFVGEPVFVPKPEGDSEDAGWLLVMVYDAGQHRSDLVILDAGDLTRGPLARLHLKYHIPYGLHGSWSPICFIRQK